MYADCYHPVVNGVVTSIDILRTKLTSLGHDVELFVPFVPGKAADDPKVHRFPSFVAPVHRESRLSLYNPFRHVRGLRAWRPDVLHVHTPFNTGVLGVYASHRIDVPYVFTHHTLFEEYVHYVPVVSKTMLRRAAVGLCRFFWNRSGGVIAPSDEVRARVLEQGVSRPVEVIPTGIDVEVFAQGDPQRVRTELGICPNEPVAIFAGRMGKEKSIDFVIDAFALTLQKLPSARLILLGGGPEQSALEAQARRLGISERTTFTGYVPRTRMVDYLQAARVFVFASTTETQGLVSLEAQAAGIPVVAVRASGSNEAVRDQQTGFLVEGDKQVFADATLRLLTDDALQASLAAQARAWADSCSSQRMADRTLALYQGAQAFSRSRLAR